MLSRANEGRELKIKIKRLRASTVYLLQFRWSVLDQWEIKRFADKDRLQDYIKTKLVEVIP